MMPVIVADQRFRSSHKDFARFSSSELTIKIVVDILIDFLIPLASPY
jgi:hypothetical protein